MPGQRVRLPWLGTLLLLLVSATCANSPASNSTQAVSASASAITTLSANAFTIEQARKLVAEGHKKMADANKARVSNVRRNNYSLKPGSLASRAIDEVDTTSFVVTDELAAAAALVAEADAAEKLKNGTLQTDYSEFMGTGSFDTRDTSNKRGGESWWMANLDNLGTQPFGGDNSYKVFRNVRDFGAKGNGHDDDTAAINRAIADGNRCGANCYGSTVKAAVVYFPPGTYLVSGSILSYFHTQLIGDATNFPTIKAAGSFQGLGVISTDFYYTEGGTGIDGNSREWYINTANFYRQIRNFIIDIRDTPWNTYVAGLHYQVAQATSLSRVNFICSSDDNTTQQAIFAENGSGGFMSDLVFHGGNFGIYGGSQQFTAQRLTFSGCKTAVQLIWDWGWIWREIAVSNCKTAFRLISEDGVHHTGSLLLQDSTIQDTDTAILSFPPVAETRKGTTGITIDNCAFSNVKSVIKDTEGKTWVDGSVGSIDTYSLGPTFSKTSKGTYSMGNQFKTPRVESLTKPTGGLPKPAYFSKRRPEYEGAKIVQMKHSTKGDGSTDDTAAFQKVINDNAGTGNVIFIDAGSYILTDTITIPSGSRIVGQAWAQLVASGPKFQDERNPHVLFRVGAQGEKGNVEIQDLLFTTRGPTAGLVAVEWNLEADGQGTAGLWDCHVRIGGAKGTDLTVSDCPTSSTNPKCKAGAMMFHMTNTGSAYIENMWLWVADHDIDDANMTQLSVYVARGMLVESTKPVWLYGTASEHAVFYQYEFFKAKNVLAAMIQTESAYFQPNPLPPAPFQNAVDVFPGDPDYKTCSSDQDGCDESWALIIDGSADITISGAGLYSWFRNYAQTCVDTQDCQKALTYLKNNKDGIHIYNMITIGAQRMIDSKAHTGSYEISARDYTHVNYHPYWSQISLFDPIAIEDDGSGGHNVTYVPRGIWDNGTTVPTASCIPPCTLVLPPSPLPDGTTIPWPSYTTELLSSIGPGQYKTVTTTLSVKPITTTEIEFATVTINEGDGTTGCFSAEQSVTPTSFIVTLPPSVAPIPPTHFPIYKQGQPVSTPTETATPTFYSTSHGFTFQPQATMSVYLDDHTYTVTLQPGTHDGVTYAPVTSATTNASPVVCWTSAAPKETCTSNCGKHDCDKFGCDGKCGEFGCDGGCGLWGCGGGCGLFGCGTGCAPVIGCPPGCKYLLKNTS